MTVWRLGPNRYRYDIAGVGLNRFDPAKHDNLNNTNWVPVTLSQRGQARRDSMGFLQRSFKQAATKKETLLFTTEPNYSYLLKRAQQSKTLDHRGASWQSHIFLQRAQIQSTSEHMRAADPIECRTISRFLPAVTPGWSTFLTFRNC